MTLKEKRKILRDAKRKIYDLEVRQQKIYEDVIRKMGYFYEADGYLFDYLYNSTGTVNSILSHYDRATKRQEALKRG
jgi:hypothetical protein